jgi:hypothetical protein
MHASRGDALSASTIRSRRRCQRGSEEITNLGRRDGRQKQPCLQGSRSGLYGTGPCAEHKELKRQGMWDAGMLQEMDLKFQAAMTSAITSGAESAPTAPSTCYGKRCPVANYPGLDDCGAAARTRGRAHSFRRSATRQLYPPVRSSCRIETRHGHRQHSNRQDRTDEGICLEPPVEFARISLIVTQHAFSHDDPPATEEPSNYRPGHIRGSVIWFTDHSAQPRHCRLSPTWLRSSYFMRVNLTDLVQPQLSGCALRL